MTSRSEMPRTADIARALAEQGVEVEYVKWPPEREDGHLFTPAPEPLPGQTEMPGDFDG